jgi:uncharacterized phage protein (predicted DNA packaging)
MSITTLSLLKKQANIDHTDDDELLQHYLDTAEGWISDYCGVVLADLSPFPAQIKHAAMLLASYWYEQREAGAFGVSINSIPFGVIDLIQPYRKWTLQHVE